jgi:hypothetical protein
MPQAVRACAVGLVAVTDSPAGQEAGRSVVGEARALWHVVGGHKVDRVGL